MNIASKKFALLIFVLFAFYSTQAQNISVNSEQEEYYRELQLLDKSKIYNSFSIRPVMARVKSAVGDTVLSFFDGRTVEQNFVPGTLSLLPLRTDLQLNTKRPFGWNNGSMIYAKGGQARISTGMRLHYSVFDIKFQPEFISAANRPYETSNLFGSTNPTKYQRFFPGQSYAQVNLWPIAIGFSNENIWWGPGQYNALLFTNNAPGFGHLHFSTRKPIRTPVFDFEWQFIAGGIDQDTLLGSEVFYQKPAPYTRKWRYVNGVIMSIQPKLIPGLYLGFTRAMQFYSTGLDATGMKFLEKYLPAVTAFFNKDINAQSNAPNQNDGRDQQASVFLRLLLPKENLETYFEYGYNDFKDNTRDFIIDAQHSAAYIVGFKKLVPTSKNNYLSITGELTQMAQSVDYVVRQAGNWYEHGTMLQGFTHMNQILGAGSGFGNNLQTLHLEKVSGLNRMGIRINRLQNDPRRVLGDVNSVWMGPYQWVDVSFGPTIQHVKGLFLAKGEIQLVHSRNYAWKPKNIFNVFATASIVYKW